MEIHIRNMVCDRCIKAVDAIFKRSGAFAVSIVLGTVKLEQGLSTEQETMIRKLLLEEGFEWLDDQNLQTAEKIKQLIVELVHYGNLDELKENLSQYLAAKLHKEYHYLSALFSSTEHTTIEHYFILQKIEKVKEWLAYDEYTLNQMAFRLGYSSVAHLSGQFKKVTGYTPSQFKKLKGHHRQSLDKV